jgi:hypothetical protein
LRAVTGSQSTQRDLPSQVNALLATLMADNRPDDLSPETDRLEAALETEGAAAPRAVDEIRSAIELVRGGQPCAAVSALLAARSALGIPSA